eukprot:6820211-Prymnesium_polylepis.1
MGGSLRRLLRGSGQAGSTRVAQQQSRGQHPSARGEGRVGCGSGAQHPRRRRRGALLAEA